MSNGAAQAVEPRESGAGAVPAVSVQGLSVTFGATHAVRDVTIALAPGTWTALVGENGAGKSTLLNVLSGTVEPTEGWIERQGSRVAFRSQLDANRSGLFRWFQEAPVLPDLKVYEAALVGFEGRFVRSGALNRGAMRDLVARHAERVFGSTTLVSASMRDVDHGDAQLLQMVRMLCSADLLDVSAPIFLMDEPTAVLSEGRAEQLLTLLQEERDRGGTIVYVTHRLREVMNQRADVVVMRDGSVTGALHDSDVTEAAMHALMVGRDRTTDYYPESRQRPAAPAVVFRVHLPASMVEPGQQNDIEIHRGEILGLAGVEGAGRETVIAGVLGLEAVSEMTVTVAETTVHRDPRSMLNAGVAVLPVDRSGESLIVEQPIWSNIALPSLSQFRRRVGPVRLPVLDLARAKGAASAVAESLRIKASSFDAPVSTLSGGNQQRVALAKWAMTGMRVLIAVDPTQGVDVGTREQCYAFFRKFCEEGGAILLASNDLPELIGLSHRIVVMRSGMISGRLAHEPDSRVTEHDVIRMMTA